MEEKNLQLDRMVFFCDAVVAIAITLLVFNLKLNPSGDAHLTFKHLLEPWKSFVAFLLSFFNIANFWKLHHNFFAHIKKIDEKLLWFNIGWLFFIVMLPFTTSLVSNYFFDTPAIFLYSLNTLCITIFQNMIWDYPYMKDNFLDIKTSSSIDDLSTRIRIFCNLDMINAGIAVILSFFSPLFAFILLFTKLPMIIITGIYLAWEHRKKKVKEAQNKESA